MALQLYIGSIHVQSYVYMYAYAIVTAELKEGWMMPERVLVIVSWSWQLYVK